jgi:hypothetical protein
MFDTIFNAQFIYKKKSKFVFYENIFRGGGRGGGFFSGGATPYYLPMPMYV